MIATELRDSLVQCPIRPLLGGVHLTQSAVLRDVRLTTLLSTAHQRDGRLIWPISARYRDGLSLRVSERILVSRLERRSRQFLEGPSGRERRSISIAC